MSNIKILAFTSSLRKESTNLKLVKLASEIAGSHGAKVDLADFHDFEALSYDADLPETDFPRGIRNFAERIMAADGLLLSLPEYNFSIPGNFKNAVDWVSRIKPVPLRGKSALLLSASIGAVGGIRGLWQSRIPLEGLGTFVYPDMFALAHSHEAFDGTGRLKDGQNMARLEKIISSYLKVVPALRIPAP
jgi:chromate reductase